MACFTENQQRNGTNCQFEKYVTTSNYFVLNSLDKDHLNSVCTHYVCDKSESACVCAKWQWNALDWCYLIALPASPVVQSSNTVSCVSLSFRTHLCVLAIRSHGSKNRRIWHKLGVSVLLKFESTNGYEMMHKAWSSIEKVPYCFSRSYIELQGHTALQIIDFDPNWAFPDCISSLKSPMATKWCKKLEVA